MPMAPRAGTLSIHRKSLARELTLPILLWALVIRLIPIGQQLLAQGSVQTYHSGGLFWAFVEAIKANGYRLPTSIPNYTANGLPFAYPPLAFYLVAAISDVFKTGPGTILVVNATLSFLGVVAFAKLLDNLPVPPTGRMVALLAFATLPQTFGEQLPGEGLAEATGGLCLVLFVGELLRMEREASWKRSVYLGALLGLNVLASPGTAYAAPVTTVIYFVVHLLTTRDPASRWMLTRYLACTIAVSLTVASPYLLHVQAEYGVQILFGAFGGQQPSSLTNLVKGAQSTLLPAAFAIPVWNICALIGLAYCFSTGRYFWTAWAFFIALVPREGYWLAGLPVSILAAIGISQVLLPAFDQSVTHRLLGLPLSNGALVVIALGMYAAMFAPLSAIVIERHDHNRFDEVGYVTTGEADYLQSLRETPPGTRILMMGNEIEWAPLLSGRTVLNVIFGTEWVPDKARAIREMNESISSARSADQLLDSVEYMERKYPLVFPSPDLLYLSKHDAYPRGNPRARAELQESLSSSRRLAVQFESDDVAVYRWASPGR